MRLKSYLDRKFAIKRKIVVVKNDAGAYTVNEYVYDGLGNRLHFKCHGNTFNRTSAYAKRREILETYK